ncbi:MAG: NTP transferase domain-containing protein [FCB group bacterium]|nr:NTP transferase domain-containing protein [FCB group bacterium]
MYAVIMAGGSGTRFWPYSRNARPKQLLKIIGKKSMLQMTVDRLLKLKFINDLFIVTRQDLAPLIQAEIKGVKPGNIIVEPSGKNTAPCIGLAALYIAALKEDAVMSVFPADHLIIGHRKFARAISTANHLAKKNNTLVTIGITPTYPATGYGYIQYESESEEDHFEAYRVRTFAEKPHLSVAKRFLQSGDFLWNSGIFIWKVSSLFKELKAHMPELYEHLMTIGERIRENRSFTDVWEEIYPVSIDYGLMEKVKRDVYVIKATFEWSDLGSWNAVYDRAPKKKGGNVVKGEGVVLDGENNFVQSNGRFTAVMGLDNIVVVNTEDATLVIPRDRVEEVRVLVDWLKRENRQELL